MRKFILMMTLPLAILLLYLLSYQMNVYVGDFVVNFLYPKVRQWDPDNVYLVLSLSGIINATFSIVFISLFCLITKRDLKECGFNLLKWKLSIKLVLIFFTVFMMLYVLIGKIAADNHLFEYQFNFLFNVRNYSGIFLFELVISGLEEIYPRGFLFVTLLSVGKMVIKNKKKLIQVVVIASTGIYTFRHIGVILFPFDITYVVPLQLVVTTVMGLSFGYIFLQKNKLIRSIFSA